MNKEQPGIPWPDGWTPDTAPEEVIPAPVVSVADEPPGEANLQLMFQWDAESQTFEVQGEEKRIHPGGCGCEECKEDRQEHHEARQEQARERCEADMLRDPRYRRMRIYRFRARHKFPLFYRCHEERELLQARREARKQPTAVEHGVPGIISDPSTRRPPR